MLLLTLLLALEVGSAHSHAGGGGGPDARRLNHHVALRPLGSDNTVVQPVPLRDVRLTAGGGSGGWHRTQQQQTLTYLTSLDADRLLFNFRVTAGIPTRGAQPYTGGWEDPTCELRGHFVGHYLSATAFLYASTGDARVSQQMAQVVDGLAECQAANGTGYLSAFPAEEFDRLEANKPVWAPYYTIHKILAGLFDQATVANNPRALTIALGMVDYFYGRVKNVLAKQGMAGWQRILEVEWGGMNEVLYNIYALSADPKHLELANLFDHYEWSAPLAAGIDDLAGNHANTHIPEIIGAQRGYELTANATQLRIAETFFRVVTQHHSYPTGGSNFDEYWSQPDSIGSTLTGTVQQESCTQYNILKVARHFFQQTAATEYMDFYEHALTNGIIGNQRIGHPGQYIYMLPMGQGGITKGANSVPGDHTTWGRPFVDFWCCYGTLVESMAKLGDSIYFTSADGSTLHVAQYVSSSLYWAARGINVTQDSELFESPTSTLRITAVASGGGVSFTLRLRVPQWTANATITVNGGAYPGPVVPGESAVITRTWTAGDTVVVSFPPRVSAQPIQDPDPLYTNTYALFYGPVMLVALSDAPVRLGADRGRVADVVTRDRDPAVPGVTMSFTARDPLSNTTTTLIPFFQAMEQRYSAYFNLPYNFTPVSYSAAGSVIGIKSVWDLQNARQGCDVMAIPLWCIRSGDPNQNTFIDVARPVIDPSHTISSVELDFQYQSGYMGGHTGTNFSLLLVPPNGPAVTVYTSPQLTDYQYDICNTCYSPVQRVLSPPLNLAPCEPHLFRFAFTNNDRNLMLLLNINITVRWA